MHIENLKDSLTDGIKLINLLEVISEDPMPRYNKHPRIINQKIENCLIALKFIAAHDIKLVNIGAEDLANGNQKLNLGLIWTLILRWQIRSQGNDSGAKQELLKWVQKKIPKANVKNFKTDWNDGRAINALVNACQPTECRDWESQTKGASSCTNGIDVAYNKMGIPRLLMGDEMANPKVDEHSVMTYISQFKNWDEENAHNKVHPADLCRAWGQGLVEGIQEEPGDFNISTPCDGKLVCKVTGPKGESIPCTMKPVGNGQYACTYTPKNAGLHKISITFDDKHIPGSIFNVNILEDLSLGGEGKIRVYYSTTTATLFQSRPMQELLEKKGVHLREDFEPWIPVDLMDRVDRDAVFKKSGTKNLPIVYIDDVYSGDWETLQKLEASGELDKRLKTLAQKTGAKGGLKSGQQVTSTLGANAGPQSVTLKSSTPTTTSAPKPTSSAAPKSNPNATHCPSCGQARKGKAKFCTCGNMF